MLREIPGSITLFHTDDWVRFVEIYLDAERRGHSPLLALQNAYDQPENVINGWVETARQCGYLQGANNEEGRLGEAALAVSRALGVTYERLVEVVRQHAGGVLRV